MYKLEDIREIHLELTSKCQASCPMCPRRISGGVLNPFITLEEITLETFKSYFTKSFISQLDSLFMCGTRSTLLPIGSIRRCGVFGQTAPTTDR